MAHQIHPGPKQLEFFVKQPLRPIWPHITPEFRDAFWRKIDVGGKDDCWPWTGRFGAGGYGQFTFSGKTFVASRVSLTIASCRDHADFHVCHSCDNPSCCNPRHLFCGNDQANANDRRAKGRYKAFFSAQKAIDDLEKQRERIRTMLISCQQYESHHDPVTDHLEKMLQNLSSSA